MRLNKSGFTTIEILLAIITIAIVSGVGFYVYDASKDEKQPQPSSQVSPLKDNSSAKKTYADKLGKFSLQYPKSWKVDTKTEDIKFDPGSKASETTITSPSGTKVIAGYNPGVSGLGGGCPEEEPNVNKQPDQPNNTCATYEILSSVGSGYKLNNSNEVQLIKSRLSQPGNGTTYYVGLIGGEDDLGAQKKPALTINIPEMFRFNINIPNNPAADYSEGKGAFVYVYAKTRSKDFLNNADGREVEQILKTFKFDN